jgi:hypothetical protein
MGGSVVVVVVVVAGVAPPPMGNIASAKAASNNRGAVNRTIFPCRSRNDIFYCRHSAGTAVGDGQ